MIYGSMPSEKLTIFQYGKSELQPSEAAWLKNLNYVRTSYCPNLHAKCYVSEDACIITSLNLYEFSQINNNEMGILLKRSEDGEVYQDAYSEAQRIIRISDEVKISVDVVEKEQVSQKNQNIEIAKKYDTLTVAKLAEKWGVTTEECNAKLCHAGLQEIDGKFYRLTDTGKKAGALIKKGRYGYFIVWPDSLTLEMVEAAGNNQKDLLDRFISWLIS